MRAPYLGAATPWLGLMLLFYALPIAGLVGLSFVDSTGGFGLANYAAVADPQIGRLKVILETIGMGAVVVLVSAAIATPAAWYLAKGRLSASAESLVLILVAGTFLVGPLVRTVSWRGILGVQGLVNKALQWVGLTEKPLLSLLYNDFSVVLAITYNAFPFMLFTLYLAMKAVDAKLISAARDLGAPASTAFLRVVIPLAAPGLVAGAVLVFVPVLSAILEPEMLGGPTTRLTPPAIRSEFFHAHNWGVGAALTVTLLIAGGLALAVFSGAALVAARTAGKLYLGRPLAARLTVNPMSENLAGAASVLGVLAFSLIPLVTIVVFSFNASRFYAFPITGVTLQWYGDLFGDSRIWVALANSVAIGLAVTLLATTLGTAFAFAVVRGRFRGRSAMIGFGFLPIITPVLVLAAGLQVAFVTLDLPLGYGTVVLGHAIYATPFVALMVVSQLFRYDSKLDAAARDLGAGRLSTLYRVTLPVLWPSIRAGALLAFLLSFNEWAIAFFTGRGFNTLPMLIYSMQRNGLPPTVLAYSSLTVCFVLFVAIVLVPFVTRMVKGGSR